MKLTTARENTIRAYLAAQSLIALPDYANHIFPTPVYFASAQDFAAMVQETFVQKTYKVFYLMINFGRFEDSRTRGCDDDPVLTVSYKFQLFRETQEARNSNPNSHDQLVTDMVNLRNRFLATQDITPNQIVHSPLVQVGDMITIQDCEYVVGILGDWMNFRVNVEINK